MKISKYIEHENDIEIGFYENGFVVYSLVSKESVLGLGRSGILHEGYKQVRNAILYENKRLAENKRPSIGGLLAGGEETYIPATSTPKVIKIVGKSTLLIGESGVYEALVYDQYNQVLTVSATVENKNIVATQVGNKTVKATFQNLTSELVVSIVETFEMEEDRRISGIELESAELWYTNIMLEAKVKVSEKEISDIWYIFLMGGI